MGFLARCSPTHMVSGLFCCLRADICPLPITELVPRAIRTMAYIERGRRTSRQTDISVLFKDFVNCYSYRAPEVDK